MSTRLFRNANGILAVERDGVLVYGPEKVYRAVDVTIETRSGEHWVGLPDADWVNPIDAGLQTALNLIRVEALIRGKAAVFTVPSVVTEASLRMAIAAYTQPKDAMTLARERLVAWKASTSLPQRQELVDLLTVIGI